MQDAGLSAPELRTGADTVSITFALPGVPMQEKSSEKILEFLKREPSLSAKALAEKMHMTSRAVEKQRVSSKKPVNSAALALQKADTGKLNSRPCTLITCHEHCHLPRHLPRPDTRNGRLRNSSHS